MEWRLENPREGISDVSIMKTFGGKYFLYLRHSWQSSVRAIDDYPFPSDSAAKRYYSTHYQSLKSGHAKPKWIEENFTAQ